VGRRPGDSLKRGRLSQVQMAYLAHLRCKYLNFPCENGVEKKNEYDAVLSQTCERYDEIRKDPQNLLRISFKCFKTYSSSQLSIDAG
jgi:hypothetical protein